MSRILVFDRPETLAAVEGLGTRVARAQANELEVTTSPIERRLDEASADATAPLFPRELDLPHPK